MLRNYLMPVFALVLLPVFAAPRSTPLGAESAGRGVQAESSPRGAATPNNATSGKVTQIGGKQLFNPEDICSVAKYEMHEKLSEFGVDFPDVGESGKPAASITTGTKDLGPPTEAMIALVPDPVHTHLALRFDRYIDVLQQALQDSISENTQGWIYVSQWLPWDPVPYQSSQDPINRANVHMFDADRECTPGVLIFRRNRYQQASVQGEFLLVFLVGESPTSGLLRQDQFLYAMQSWHTIQLRREALARGDAALARKKVAEAEKAATQQGKEQQIRGQ